MPLWRQVFAGVTALLHGASSALALTIRDSSVSRPHSLFIGTGGLAGKGLFRRGLHVGPLAAKTTRSRDGGRDNRGGDDSDRKGSAETEATVNGAGTESEKAAGKAYHWVQMSASSTKTPPSVYCKYPLVSPMYSGALSNCVCLLIYAVVLTRCDERIG
jgi:hypothetical protein